jgi:hypothetical protein
MIQTAFLAPLMTTIGAPPLPTAIMLSASFAAIALPAIAVAADEEDGVAIGGDTRSLPQR